MGCIQHSEWSLLRGHYLHCNQLAIDVDIAVAVLPLNHHVPVTVVFLRSSAYQLQPSSIRSHKLLRWYWRGFWADVAIHAPPQEPIVWQ